ncbi:murein L,D-transpeptidase catalytic domain family protein [Mucilaginibacter sp. UR6-11]|uniref:murein L,D-transpeptidase catalytic domain family protein n=1 Tax=Mucilaginibacter sp. UR6-11 TaxID=1435644 RepID=UPI001E41B436|nr:murein L,D-transpeptidase catalytic domain family protein [Mucilaginibacter sp. UR6-11]MCC8423654.1 murein L,D-transpeptidase catalytic domain family protein [Mucilaginibacter sp. UR6-11]
MKKHFWWISCISVILFTSVIGWTPVNATKNTTTFNAAPTAKELFAQYVNTVYQTAGLQQAGLDVNVFQKALTGYLNIKSTNKLAQNSDIITVVDFTKPSRVKRMWIIDLLNKHLLLNTWVAHGQGSGNDMATNFSDANESHQSSLGFYLADDIYVGKHGRSLRLDGLDAGFNTSARARGIVVHAADYVSESAIAQLGRLGRSFGCPAVSPQVVDLVINTIKGKSVFFINGNNPNYTSKYLNENVFASFTSPDNSDVADSVKL